MVKMYLPFCLLALGKHFAMLELTHRRVPSIILVVTPLNAIILYLTPCIMTREILINSVFNYIPAAQVQFTDVTRPFYSERR